MKKILILILSLMLCSCNYKELNSLGIVSSLLIDYKDSNYIINAEFIDASSKNNKTFFINSSGKTLEDAINLLYTKSSFKPLYSHMQTIVVSENIIKTKLKDISDFLIRNEDIRKDHTLFVSKNISDLLKVKLEGKTLGENIKDTYYNSKDENAFYISSNFREILNSNLNKKYYYLGGISKKNNTINLDNTYLMYDDKLVQKLNKKTTFAVNILKENVKSFNFMSNNISYKIYDYKVNKKIKNNTLYITIKCNLKILSSKNKNIQKYKDLKKLETDFNKKLTSYLDESILFSKNKNIDIFNINNLYYKKYNKHNKNFFKGNTKIKVISMINEKGLTNKTRG